MECLVDEVLQSDDELVRESVEVADEVEAEEDDVELLEELLAVVVDDLIVELHPGVGLLETGEVSEPEKRNEVEEPMSSQR